MKTLKINWKNKFVRLISLITSKYHSMFLVLPILQNQNTVSNIILSKSNGISILWILLKGYMEKVQHIPKIHVNWVRVAYSYFSKTKRKGRKATKMGIILSINIFRENSRDTAFYSTENCRYYRDIFFSTKRIILADFGYTNDLFRCSKASRHKRFRCWMTHLFPRLLIQFRVGATWIFLLYAS